MRALTLPRISDDAADGIFAGIGRGEYGQEDYALILLPGDVKLPSWDKSMEWAAAAGGDLPSPSEQQLLRANLPEKFQAEAYWSNKQHESDSAYAWYQTFGLGYQHYDHKSAALRAVAVSRLSIQFVINSFCSCPAVTPAAAQAAVFAEDHRPAEKELIANGLRASVAKLVGLANLMYLGDFLALEDRQQLELIAMLNELADSANRSAKQAADAICQEGAYHG